MPQDRRRDAPAGLPARVAVRVNPDFELKGSGMKMGGGPKQFGVDVEQLPALFDRIATAGLAFEGFHLFAGSQNLRAESICEAQRKSYELALRLAASAPAPVKFLNLGGGFGIPYFPGEQPLDLAPIAANLHELLANDDFAEGMARWFPVAQGYFVPWHVDNLALELLIERGAVSLAAAALAGALLVGCVSSLLDMPRVAVLLLTIVLVAAWERRESGKPVG